MTPVEMRVIFCVVLVIVLGAIGFVYVLTVTGRSVGGVLRVPQGKNFVDVCLCDADKLWPYKFGQSLELIVLPGEQTAVSNYTGEEMTAAGGLSYKGTFLGFSDSSSTYTMVLGQLAKTYKKVIVSGSIAATDGDGKPVMHLNLPDEGWFKRAIRQATI